MFSIFTKIDKKAFRNAVIATLIVIAITVIGSVNLQNYDAALMIYFFGTISMTFGIAYKHSVWLQRPLPKSIGNALGSCCAVKIIGHN